MCNGYKEGIMIDLLKANHPLTFEELSYDVLSWDIERFRGKLERLIKEGWVYKKGNKYWLTEKGREIEWPQKGVE